MPPIPEPPPGPRLCWRVQLVHAEAGSRVVAVEVRQGEELLGTALGEAPSAEAAEERAIARLQQRLRTAAASPASPERAAPQRVTPLPGSMAAMTAPAAVPATGATPGASAVADEPGRGAEPASQADPEPEPDPEDWSSELAQIELQLARLGWQRPQESAYLERAFGHPSRSRLTSFRDLVAYLQALTALEPGSDPASAAVPLRRRDLLGQCDQLLGQLGWDAARGRRFLEEQFGVASRQQLNDGQLLQFNMLLEESWLASTGQGG